MGTGLLSGCGMFLFRWGPCGPSSIWGLIFLLTAMVCFALGALFLVIGFLEMLVGRVREGAASQGLKGARLTRRLSLSSPPKIL